MFEIFEEEFQNLRTCENLDSLRKELEKTKQVRPECTAHMFYLNNKIGVIEKRITDVEKSLHDVFG